MAMLQHPLRCRTAIDLCCFSFRITPTRCPQRAHVIQFQAYAQYTTVGTGSTYRDFKHHTPTNIRFIQTRATAQYQSPRTPVDRRVYETVNPPDISRPPALVLPESTATARPTYYFNLGRAYVKFYKGAAKNIWHCFKASRELRRRLQHAPSPTAPGSGQGFMARDLKENKVTRGEYQLLLRTSNDLKRAPFFVLVICVFGEFTPLLVRFLGPVIPKTAWLPGQWRSEALKQESRVWAGARRLKQLDAQEELKTLPVLQQQNEINTNRRYTRVIREMAQIPLSLDYRSPMHSTSLIILTQWKTKFLLAGFTLGLLQKSTIDTFLRHSAIAASHTTILDDYAIIRDGGVHALLDDEILSALRARNLDLGVVEQLANNDAEHYHTRLRETLGSYTSTDLSKEESPYTKALDGDRRTWSHLKYKSQTPLLESCSGVVPLIGDPGVTDAEKENGRRRLDNVAARKALAAKDLEALKKGTEIVLYKGGYGNVEESVVQQRILGIRRLLLDRSIDVNRQYWDGSMVKGVRQRR